MDFMGQISLGIVQQPSDWALLLFTAEGQYAL